MSPPEATVRAELHTDESSPTTRGESTRRLDSCQRPLPELSRDRCERCRGVSYVPQHLNRRARGTPSRDDSKWDHFKLGFPLATTAPNDFSHTGVILPTAIRCPGRHARATQMSFAPTLCGRAAWSTISRCR